MSLQVLKLFFMVAFYVSLNFVWQIIPLLLVGALYFNIAWCRLLVILAVFDMLIPLKSKPHGYWPWFFNISSCAKGGEEYNQVEVIVESEAAYDRRKNYLVCYLPHSLYMYNLWGVAKYFHDNLGSRVLFAGADVIFRVPLLRRVMTWWGCTRASAQAMKQTLQIPFPRNILLLSVDGIAGMFYGIDQEQVVIERRRGFCRIALETGASLVPCYVFGTNELYHRKFGPDSLAAKISRAYHISCVYWTGRFGVPFGFVPCNQKLVVALGAPIDVEKKETPTKEEIDALHTVFTVALRELFDRHKHKMGADWVKRRSRLYFETEKLPSPEASKKKD